MQEKKSWLIYLMVFSVTIIWGLNVVMLKVLVENLPPLTMTGFRILLAGMTAFLIVVILRKFERMSRKAFLYTLLGALFGVTLHHVFMAYGLTMVDASTAALILALVPITTALFGLLFLGELMTKMRGIGFVLAIIGVLFIQSSGLDGLSLSFGEFIIFLAMLTQAVSFIFVKKATQNVDSRHVTVVMMFAGALGLLLISFIFEPGGLSGMVDAPLWVYGAFFFSGIVATGAGYFIFNTGIQMIGASQTVIFNNFIPFFGVMFSVMFLGDNVYWVQLFGFLFIVLGVLFGTGYIERTYMRQKRKYLK